jgi:hypothetical protein
VNAATAGREGDPLKRETERVSLDPIQGKVLHEVARADHGMGFMDAPATVYSRSMMR